MGDMADANIEAGELELMLHNVGQCEWACRYCDEEHEQMDQG